MRASSNRRRGGRGAAALLGLALAIAACGGGPNDLWGSVDEVYDLGFDTVGALEIGDYLVVEYRKGEAKVVKLSVSLAGLTVQPDVEIDLLEMVSNAPRGALQRIVGSTIDLPMQNGRLTFQEVPIAGQIVKGGFRALLAEPEGRTLNGDFEATLVEVAP